MDELKSNSKWKDFLLKSSLPLEFEVKRKLFDLGFHNKYEYTYLRENDESKLIEFSYDIDSYKEIENHCFELMVECKYRDDSTNWLFLPEEYNNSDRGIGGNDFLNTNDLFFKDEYPDFFKVIMFRNLAPLCSKGIEICSGGQNPKSITQAISQLSYALFDKLIYGFERQLNYTEIDGHFIYHHIPIIVTTANLYRLKSDVSIQQIKKSNDLLEIATKEPILLIEPPFSIDLKNYALNKFANFETKYSIKKLNDKLGKQARTNNRDYEFHKSYMTDYPCGILVVHFETDGNVFNELNQLLEEIVRPQKTTIDEIDNMLGSKIKALDSFR